MLPTGLLPGVILNQDPTTGLRLGGNRNSTTDSYPGEKLQSFLPGAAVVVDMPVLASFAIVNESR
jgi:hypothetical protein